MRKFRASVFFHSICFLAFVAALVPLALAQNASEAGATQAAPRVYDATKEVTLRGTISEVTARPTPGLPLGLHVMVATAQGTVDVHLGPYLAPVAAEKGLIPGAAIQMTGLTAHFDPGDVFLARIVVVGNQTITVRNDHGIPARPTPPAARTTRSPEPTGGL